MEFSQPQAHDLFIAIAHDRKLPNTAKPGSGENGTGGTHPIVADLQVPIPWWAGHTLRFRFPPR